MMIAPLAPEDVDTLLAALLRRERVTLPLIDELALLFGLLVTNLSRDFVADLKKENVGKMIHPSKYSKGSIPVSQPSAAPSRIPCGGPGRRSPPALSGKSPGGRFHRPREKT